MIIRNLRIPNIRRWGLVLLTLGTLCGIATHPSPAAAAEPTPTPRAEAQPAAPLPLHYTISADLNYDKHTLAVTEDIDYRNETGDTLEELLLVIPPNRRKEVFHLDSLVWADGSKVETFRLRGDLLQIYLRTPLKPNESLQVRLVFTLSMPFVSSAFGYTFRQVNFGDWYPFAPPYRKGKGWLVNEFGKVGEYLVYDLADFDVEINLVGRQDVTIAAPAPAEARGSTFRYQHKNARNFAWSASPNYQIVWSNSGDVSVMGYVFTNNLEEGKSAAWSVGDALSLFSEWYSPYPHPLFTFVEADFADGMEYDGLYFLDRVYFQDASNGDASGLTALSVHETAHQWWGQRISNNQALEPWLDEALATYHEYLYYENRFPFLRNWWWNYRVLFFKPRGTVNANIYRFSDERAYINAIYLRGALFLRDIRAAVGDEAFLKFLKIYEERYRNKQVSSEDFFRTLGEVSTSSIQDALDEYFQK